ncbi:hypothetical protein [Mycoplasma sp. Sp33II]|uniref:hypothetical protein n=1 Tax=unclassified Mycoplasma TaxID=2683645 RepID=UPI003AABAEBC
MNKKLIKRTISTLGVPSAALIAATSISAAENADSNTNDLGQEKAETKDEIKSWNFYSQFTIDSINKLIDNAQNKKEIDEIKDRLQMIYLNYEPDKSIYDDESFKKEHITDVLNSTKYKNAGMKQKNDFDSIINVMDNLYNKFNSLHFDSLEEFEKYSQGVDLLYKLDDVTSQLNGDYVIKEKQDLVAKINSTKVFPESTKKYFTDQTYENRSTTNEQFQKWVNAVDELINTTVEYIADVKKFKEATKDLESLIKTHYDEDENNRLREYYEYIKNDSKDILDDDSTLKPSIKDMRPFSDATYHTQLGLSLLENYKDPLFDEKNELKEKIDSKPYLNDIQRHFLKSEVDKARSNNNLDKISKTTDTLSLILKQAQTALDNVEKVKESVKYKEASSESKSQYEAAKIALENKYNKAQNPKSFGEILTSIQDTYNGNSEYNKAEANLNGDAKIQAARDAQIAKINNANYLSEAYKQDAIKAINDLNTLKEIDDFANNQSLMSKIWEDSKRLFTELKNQKESLPFAGVTDRTLKLIKEAEEKRNQLFTTDDNYKLTSFAATEDQYNNLMDDFTGVLSWIRNDEDKINQLKSQIIKENNSVYGLNNYQKERLIDEISKAWTEPELKKIQKKSYDLIKKMSDLELAWMHAINAPLMVRYQAASEDKKQALDKLIKGNNKSTYYPDEQKSINPEEIAEKAKALNDAFNALDGEERFPMVKQGYIDSINNLKNISPEQKANIIKKISPSNDLLYFGFLKNISNEIDKEIGKSKAELENAQKQRNEVKYINADRDLKKNYDESISKLEEKIKEALKITNIDSNSPDTIKGILTPLNNNLKSDEVKLNGESKLQEAQKAAKEQIDKEQNLSKEQKDKINELINNSTMNEDIEDIVGVSKYLDKGLKKAKELQEQANKAKTMPKYIYASTKEGLDKALKGLDASIAEASKIEKMKNVAKISDMFDALNSSTRQTEDALNALDGDAQLKAQNEKIIKEVVNNLQDTLTTGKAHPENDEKIAQLAKNGESDKAKGLSAFNDGLNKLTTIKQELQAQLDKPNTTVKEFTNALKKIIKDTSALKQTQSNNFKDLSDKFNKALTDLLNNQNGLLQLLNALDKRNNDMLAQAQVALAQKDQVASNFAKMLLDNKYIDLLIKNDNKKLTNNDIEVIKSIRNTSEFQNAPKALQALILDNTKLQASVQDKPLTAQPSKPELNPNNQTEPEAFKASMLWWIILTAFAALIAISGLSIYVFNKKKNK